MMSSPPSPPDSARAAALLSAQAKALALFTEIETTLLRPGISEKALSDAIHAVGQERHGVRTHWHKRVVRSGPNTLAPFNDNPPDRVIQDDDILVVDLGPVFEEWEADFGRTYVLGNDEEKIRLRDALEPLWEKVKKIWEGREEMTGEELYRVAVEEVEKEGWVFGADLAGHLVGQFPHERIPRDKVALYIKEGNGEVMRKKGKDGHMRHWILEMHLRNKEQTYGGFYEQLLSCG